MTNKAEYGTIESIRDHGLDTDEDELYRHVDGWTHKHWVGSGDEMRGVASAVLGEPIEEFSPIDGIISASSVAGWNAAMCCIGDMLGIDSRAAEELVENYCDGNSECAVSPIVLAPPNEGQEA